MASINFDDYEKNQQDQSPGDEVVTKKISIGRLETSDIQYYVAEENVLFDFIELNFGEEQGVGIEVWMSYLGEDFKLKIDMMEKEDFEKIVKDNDSLGNLIGDYLNENLDCVACKSSCLDDLCDIKHGKEDEDD